MATYRSKRLKVLDQEEKRIVKRIVIAVIGLILLGAAVFFGGIPILVSLGWLLSGNKPQPSIVTNNSPLLAPTLDPLETATNSAKITVTGSGLEGTTITLFLNNGSFDQKLVGKDGSFTFTNVPLAQGQNTLYALPKSVDGKSSPKSQVRQILFNNKPPQLTINNPQDGQNFSNVKDIKVTGTTDPSTSVTVNDTIAIINQDGSFSVDLPISSGKQTIKVVATDTAGNQATVQRDIYNNT